MSRTPWNAGNGCIPQVFRIGDIVKIRQDGSAPLDWCGDWANVRLQIVGTIIDDTCQGRAAYFVHAEDQATREHDPMSEDWLESAKELPA